MTAATLLTAGLLAQSAGIAHAHNYSGASSSTSNCSVGYTGAVNNQDNNPHTFYYGTSNQTVQNYSEWARIYQVEPTSVNTTLQNYVDSLTDVVVYSQYYTTFCGQTWWNPATGSGTLGLTVCVSLSGDGSGRCDKHEVRYNQYWTDQAGDTGLRSLTCHETGHTMGLTHPVNEDGDSCMVYGQTSAIGYTEHDVAHLNGGSQSLYANWQLNCNQSMFSWDGTFRATMQTDGNFVVYRTSNNQVMWSSNHFHSGCNAYVVMQGDGNVVIYYPNGAG